MSSLIDGQHHNQIDYILVRKRFRSGVNIARTRSFPGADNGSDHDLLMMTFRLRLKKTSKPKHTRLKFELEKLKDPSVLETFQTMTRGKFAPLTIINDKDTDLDSMITTFNTAVTETASEILGKHRLEKKKGHSRNSWSVRPKKKRIEKKILRPEGSDKCKKVHSYIKRCMKKAKENLIEEQCSEITENLRKNKWNKGKVQSFKIVQKNASQKNERYWTDGQITALRCTITWPIYQYWTVPRQSQRFEPQGRRFIKIFLYYHYR